MSDLRLRMVEYEPLVILLKVINFQELHPDVNPGPKAAMQFIEVKDAYNMIGKAENRKTYKASEEW